MLVRPPSGKKVLWQEMLRHELLSALDERRLLRRSCIYTRGMSGQSAAASGVAQAPMRRSPVPPGECGLSARRCRLS